jgi:hypothetical protein
MRSKIINDILRCIPENELKWIDEINDLKARIMIAQGRIRGEIKNPFGVQEFQEGVDSGLRKALKILNEELER